MRFQWAFVAAKVCQRKECSSSQFSKEMFSSQASFGDAMMELRSNISSILDLQQMSVDTFVNNPRMMVEMFRSVAVNELTFIQRIAAFMGFLLGLVQVVIYLLLEGVAGMDYILLPVSGLIIGYLTNWIAIKMIFRPVWPHQYCQGRTGERAGKGNWPWFQIPICHACFVSISLFLAYPCLPDFHKISWFFLCLHQDQCAGCLYEASERSLTKDG